MEAPPIQDEAEVRAQAVEALAGIGQRPEEVVPALVALLADEELSIRMAALRALGAFGAAGAEAVSSPCACGLQRLLPLLVPWLKRRLA